MFVIINICFGYDIIVQFVHKSKDIQESVG
jgi:hypothetical protein